MWLLKILLAGVVIYVFFVGLVWLFQERIAFPSPRRSLPRPQAMGIHDAEKVSVTTSDGVTLYGWYLKPSGNMGAMSSVSGSSARGRLRSESQGVDLSHTEPPEAAELPPARSVVPREPDDLPGESLGEFGGRRRDVGRAPALIWFYGNYETVSVLAPVLQILRPPGWGVLALDIRGYGESEGEANETGFYRDAEAAWNFLTNRPEIDSTGVAVYGRSLGTAMALHLAASKPVAAVILEAPFTSGPDLARVFYWWVPPFAVRIKMNNLAKAEEMDAPLLVVHGADDNIVPLEMGRSIAEAGRAEAFMVFENAGHNDMLLGDPDRYRGEWMAFLKNVAEVLSRP